LNERLSALLADVRPEPKYIERLAIKTTGRVVFLKVDDIDWIEAADNYVNLHAGQEAHLHRETMTSLEGRLPPNKFMRISRSTIVNVERIKELQPLFHGEYAVILRNGTRLTLSRSYREKLQQLLGNSI
jgi:two-component system LytT family response regulator